MSPLERRVSNAVDSWRLATIVATVVSVGIGLVDGEIVSALISILFAFPMYFFGIFVIAQYFSTIAQNDPDLLRDIQTRRIRNINQRLADGTLEADSDELEQEMEKAGLKPLTIMKEFGPIFGKHGDADMYEWIDAQEGKSGEVLRYFFVDRAQFDDDGVAIVPTSNGKYIVIDGYLYEHNPELVQKAAGET